MNTKSHMLRRLSLAGLMIGFALVMAGCEKKAVVDQVGNEEATLGSPAAKVTIIEYASPACPICAHFNETVFPDLKGRYITPGKIKYVYRPMLTGNEAVATAGTLLAECAGKDKYFDVIDAIMRAQKEMGGEETGYANARPVLLRIANSMGMSQDQFDKCITNQKAILHLSDTMDTDMKNGINATPTFFVAGPDGVSKKFDYQGGGIAEFDTELKPLLAH